MLKVANSGFYNIILFSFFFKWVLILITSITALFIYSYLFTNYLLCQILTMQFNLLQNAHFVQIKLSGNILNLNFIW